MFWRFNVINTQIDTLLDREDITLQEILDEDDVLQECKAQNPRLLEFLVKPENMDELVNWVTQEPKEDTEEKKGTPLLTLANLDVQTISDKLARYKYPNIACELLTSDCPQITEKLAGEETYLNKIYSFLESEGQVNSLLSSFFSKVMGLLIARKSDLMLEFLKTKEDCISHLLRHLGTSAFMDLLLRLITCIDSPETRLACVNWLSDQSIIQKLVALIDAEHTEDKHCNASQSLCDIIRLSRDQMSQLQDKADPDPLLATIESCETVSDLLDHMFKGESKVESVLINGLQVIQTLLEFRKVASGLFFSPEGCQEMMTALDKERLELGVSNTMKAVIPRLKDLHEILIDPPKQHYHTMPTTVGHLDPPLGNTRLQAIRLISSILFSNTHEANVQIANLSTLGTLLDLFFKYSWNNFLHTQVEQCLCTVFNNSPTSSSLDTDEDKTEHTLLNQLFTELKFIERILDVWEENEQSQTRPGGHRKGYMGHLLHIANSLVDSIEKGSNGDRIKQLLKEYPEELQERWQKFLSSSLADANKTNTLQMVGSNALHSSSDSEDPDFSNIHFPQESAMQQAFSDYQLHQMTSTFIDQFGFKEDEFTEQEERVDAPFTDRISSINFEINSDQTSNNAAHLFEQACNERLQQFDDHDSDEDLWEEKEVTFTPKPGTATNDSSVLSFSAGSAGSRPRAGSQPDEAQNSSDESTDSEEELTSPQKIYQSPSKDEKPTEKMEVSENFANFDNFPVAMDTGNAAEDWAKFDNISSSTKDDADNETGWANFSNLEEMESATSKDEERSNSPVAMDTADTSAPANRMAQYMVSSSPGDTVESSTVQEPHDAAQQPTSSSSDNELSPPSTPRPAWGSAPNTPLPSGDQEHTPSVPLTVSPDTSNTISSTTGVSSAVPDSPVSQSTEQSAGVDLPTSSSNSNSSINSSDNILSTPPQSSNSQGEAIGSSCQNEPSENTSTSTNEASAAENRVESSEYTQTECNDSKSSVESNEVPQSDTVQSPELMESGDALIESNTVDDDLEDDLSDNFNFLSSGLMSGSRRDDEPNGGAAEASSTQDNQVNSSTAPASESESCADASNDATPDTASQSNPDTPSEQAPSANNKLEELRAQAREALEDFSSATSPSSSSQNGPV